MTVWTTLTDAQITTEKPITQGIGRALRDNVSALAEGAAGAPTIIRDAISVGSSGVDGIFNDGAAPILSGIYEFAAFTLTLARTFQPISILRVNGNFTLSNTLKAGGFTGTIAQNLLADALGVSRGLPGVTSGGFGGGGASVGVGGIISGGPAAPVGYPLALSSRWWAQRRGLVGGAGSCVSSGVLGASFGGGCLIVLIHGNAILTGGTISASAPANTAGTVAHSEGGGAGGSLIVICDGTVTDGTFTAKGAAGTGDGSSSAGGGAGGYVGVVAAAYAGTQTFDVTAGAAFAGAGTPTAAGAGFSEQITLTAKQINGLIFR